MIIIDFKYTSEKQEQESTKVLANTKDALDFLLRLSNNNEDSEVLRINKYSQGDLIPYEVVVNKGRITLEEVDPDKFRKELSIQGGYGTVRASKHLPIEEIFK